MKKALIYILLFSYTFMLLRPTVPLIADALAHTFWYSQHMATVHFENGQYHVHYQYMNEAQKSFPGKNPHNTKTETFLGDYILADTKFDFSFHVNFEIHFREPSFFIPDFSPSANYPPPKA